MNFKTEEEHMVSLVQNVTQSCEVSGEELQFLLSMRSKGKISFLVIDIREMYEYSTLSIKGTDYLLPTSTIHTTLDQLTQHKNQLMIFYCRTASRTFQMIHILKRMGFTNIAHLSRGIVEYKGEKLKNAPLPSSKK